MKLGTGNLSTAEFDRTVSKFAGSTYLGKPFAARREGLDVAAHLSKAADIKKRRMLYTETLRGDVPYCGGLAVYRSCLQALAGWIRPVQGTLTLTFPAEAVEKHMRPYIIAATNAAYETGILFSDVTVRRAGLECPEITVSVTGTPFAQREEASGGNFGSEAGIVLIGKAATEATLILREKEAEKLENLYAGHFLDTTGLKQKLYPGKLMERLAAFNRYAVVPGEGGIFAALWELSEQLHLGMRVDLQKITVDPLTVEICEVLDVSPYEMPGGGAVLMVTTEPEAAVAVCAEAGQTAAVIGVLNKSNDKLIVNGDEVRYLEPFKGDKFSREYRG
ncbi:MAG: AIR synthase-related protein [Lachnospiraceae bacterium]